MEKTVQLRSLTGHEVLFSFSNGKKVRITAEGSDPLSMEDAKKIQASLRHPMEIVTRAEAPEATPAPTPAPAAKAAKAAKAPDVDVKAAEDSDE